MKKKIALLVMIIAGLQFMPIHGYAAEQSIPAEAAVSSGIEVLSQDVIETKFRIYNGKRQYRRWNVTKGCWVDPAWITLG